VIDETADLRIRVREKPGVDLHHSRIETSLIGGERIPCRHPVRTFAQCRVLWHDARLHLSREHFVTPSVPPFVELTAVWLDV